MLQGGRGGAVALAFAGFLLARSAGAEPERHWYGWQTGAVDASGFALLALDAQDKTVDEPVLVYAPAIFLGAPVVHFAHGHVGKGLGSLGIRAGCVVLGAGLAFAANPDPTGQGQTAHDPEHRRLDPTFGYLGLMAIAGGIVDAVFMAWETRERPPPAPGGDFVLEPFFQFDDGTPNELGAALRGKF